MKKSFYIIAMTMAIMMVAGAAMAGSVDIGLGRMDQAEFEALKQMVGGDFQADTFVTAEKPRETRVAEFDLSVVEDIRQGMETGNVRSDAVASASGNQKVDVGLGSMSTSEFCDLNNLVASNTTHNGGLTFICP